MKFIMKRILIIIVLFCGVIIFYKSFSINKFQLNWLINSVGNLNNEEKTRESGYKIISLNDGMEDENFYKVKKIFNGLGMEVAYEELVKDDYNIELIGEQSVYHLLGTPYVDEGCIVYDKKGNKIDAEFEVYNDVDVNKAGVYAVVYSFDEPDGSSILIARSVYVVSELPSCVGIVDRYGTTLIYNDLALSLLEQNGIILGEKSYKWNVDGVIIDNKSNKLTLKYKKVDRATLILGGKSISCDIRNNLVYDFKYDSENVKPYIGCRTYDADDKTRLECILKNAVNEAGYGTRAGVVEAARFLVGGLDYKVKYVGPKQEVDWRIGRYGKVGLNIGVYDGWGCSISGWTQGMDCTNFVHWAFVQAGLNEGNVYSTKNVYSITDVVDRLQVGDLLLTPSGTTFSHVGIIIGIDDSSIYVAEATTGSIDAIVTTRLDKNKLPTKGEFSKAKLYEYEKEGNVTNMWVS